MKKELKNFENVFKITPKKADNQTKKHFPHVIEAKSTDSFDITLVPKPMVVKKHFPVHIITKSGNKKSKPILQLNQTIRNGNLQAGRTGVSFYNTYQSDSRMVTN